MVLSPTIYTVDLTTDNAPTAAGTGSGSTGDLRYAISQANANPNPDGSIIQFDASVFGTPQTITLSSSLGTLDLTETAGPEEIDGPTVGVTVSGADAVGVFAVGQDVVASFSGLALTGGYDNQGAGLDNEGTASLDGCIITGNSSYLSGGGLFNAGKATLTDCTLTGDSTYKSAGGGLYNAGSTTLNDCVVSNNSTFLGSGAGIFSAYETTLTLANCTISGNSARSGEGGGVFGFGTTTVTNCTVSGNSAGLSGGGIVDRGGLTSLNTCTISGNRSTNGGGIQNDGTMTLNGSVVTGNSADDGAGVWNEEGVMTLIDCTVTGNSANGNTGNDSPGSAGGIYNSHATLTLTDCTVSLNSAGTNDGGLYLRYGTTDLTNTIVAGNTVKDSPSDITVGTTGQVSGSNNLIGPGGSGDIVNGADGNIVLTDLSTLDLAPLGDYGGPTQTMALLPDSAAIGNGTAVSGVTTDQRGRLDPGLAFNIGAFQDQGYTLTAASGGNQSTPVNTSFGAPLVAVLTENFQDVPLPGVTIGFAGPSSGAGAVLSAGSATTDASGGATVTAMADATAGSYAVTASAAGPTSSASFPLANTGPPVFSGLSDRTITYGTPSVVISAALSSGSQSPVGDVVAITLDGVTEGASIQSDGSFSAMFSTTSIHASPTAYTITYTSATQAPFLAASAASRLTVNPGSLTITANSQTMPFGGPVPALTASYTGFVNGDTPASLANPVALGTSATSNSESGTYLITAIGASSTDYVIRYVAGTMTVEPPATPATAQGRAAQGFVTTLYAEVLGRGRNRRGCITGRTSGWANCHLG